MRFEALKWTLIQLWILFMTPQMNAQTESVSDSTMLPSHRLSSSLDAYTLTSLTFDSNELATPGSSMLYSSSYTNIQDISPSRTIQSVYVDVQSVLFEVLSESKDIQTSSSDVQSVLSGNSIVTSETPVLFSSFTTLDTGYMSSNVQPSMSSGFEQSHYTDSLVTSVGTVVEYNSLKSIVESSDAFDMTLFDTAVKSSAYVLSSNFMSSYTESLSSSVLNAGSELKRSSDFNPSSYASSTFKTYLTDSIISKSVIVNINSTRTVALTSEDISETNILLKTTALSLLPSISESSSRNVSVLVLQTSDVSTTQTMSDSFSANVDYSPSDSFSVPGVSILTPSEVIHSSSSVSLIVSDVSSPVSSLSDIGSTGKSSYKLNSRMLRSDSVTSPTDRYSSRTSSTPTGYILSGSMTETFKSALSLDNTFTKVPEMTSLRLSSIKVIASNSFDNVASMSSVHEQISISTHVAFTSPTSITVSNTTVISKVSSVSKETTTSTIGAIASASNELRDTTKLFSSVYQYSSYRSKVQTESTESLPKTSSALTTPSSIVTPSANDFELTSWNEASAHDINIHATKSSSLLLVHGKQSSSTDILSDETVSRRLKSTLSTYPLTSMSDSYTRKSLSSEHVYSTHEVGGTSESVISLISTGNAAILTSSETLNNANSSDLNSVETVISSPMYERSLSRETPSSKVIESTIMLPETHNTNDVVTASTISDKRHDVLPTHLNSLELSISPSASSLFLSKDFKERTSSNKNVESITSTEDPSISSYNLQTTNGEIESSKGTVSASDDNNKMYSSGLVSENNAVLSSKDTTSFMQVQTSKIFSEYFKTGSTFFSSTKTIVPFLTSDLVSSIIESPIEPKLTKSSLKYSSALSIDTTSHFKSTSALDFSRTVYIKSIENFSSTITQTPEFKENTDVSTVGTSITTLIPSSVGDTRSKVLPTQSSDTTYSDDVDGNTLSDSVYVSLFSSKLSSNSELNVSELLKTSSNQYMSTLEQTYLTDTSSEHYKSESQRSYSTDLYMSPGITESTSPSSIIEVEPSSTKRSDLHESLSTINNLSTDTISFISNTNTVSLVITEADTVPETLTFAHSSKSNMLYESTVVSVAENTPFATQHASSDSYSSFSSHLEEYSAKYEETPISSPTEVTDSLSLNSLSTTIITETPSSYVSMTILSQTSFISLSFATSTELSSPLISTINSNDIIVSTVPTTESFGTYSLSSSFSILQDTFLSPASLSSFNKMVSDSQTMLTSLIELPDMLSMLAPTGTLSKTSSVVDLEDPNSEFSLVSVSTNTITPPSSIVTLSVFSHVTGLSNLLSPTQSIIGITHTILPLQSIIESTKLVSPTQSVTKLTNTDSPAQSVTETTDIVTPSKSGIILTNPLSTTTSGIEMPSSLLHSSSPRLSVELTNVMSPLSSDLTNTVTPSTAVKSSTPPVSSSPVVTTAMTSVNLLSNTPLSSHSISEYTSTLSHFSVALSDTLSPSKVESTTTDVFTSTSNTSVTAVLSPPLSSIMFSENISLLSSYKSSSYQISPSLSSTESEEVISMSTTDERSSSTDWISSSENFNFATSVLTFEASNSMTPNIPTFQDTSITMTTDSLPVTPSSTLVTNLDKDSSQSLETNLLTSLLSTNLNDIFTSAGSTLHSEELLAYTSSSLVDVSSLSTVSSMLGITDLLLSQTDTSSSTSSSMYELSDSLSMFVPSESFKTELSSSVIKTVAISIVPSFSLSTISVNSSSPNVASDQTLYGSFPTTLFTDLTGFDSLHTDIVYSTISTADLVISQTLDTSTLYSSVSSDDVTPTGIYSSGMVNTSVETNATSSISFISSVLYYSTDYSALTSTPISSGMFSFLISNSDVISSDIQTESILPSSDNSNSIISLSTLHVPFLTTSSVFHKPSFSDSIVIDTSFDTESSYIFDSVSSFSTPIVSSKEFVSSYVTLSSLESDLHLTTTPSYSSMLFFTSVPSLSSAYFVETLSTITSSFVPPFTIAASEAKTTYTRLSEVIPSSLSIADKGTSSLGSISDSSMYEDFTSVSQSITMPDSSKVQGTTMLYTDEPSLTQITLSVSSLEFTHTLRSDLAVPTSSGVYPVPQSSSSLSPVPQSSSSLDNFLQITTSSQMLDMLTLSINLSSSNDLITTMSYSVDTPIIDSQMMVSESTSLVTTETLVLSSISFSPISLFNSDTSTQQSDVTPTHSHISSILLTENIEPSFTSYNEVSSSSKLSTLCGSSISLLLSSTSIVSQPPSSKVESSLDPTTSHSTSSDVDNLVSVTSSASTITPVLSSSEVQDSTTTTNTQSQSLDIVSKSTTQFKTSTTLIVSSSVTPVTLEESLISSTSFHEPFGTISPTSASVFTTDNWQNIASISDSTNKTDVLPSMNVSASYETSVSFNMTDWQPSTSITESVSVSTSVFIPTTEPPVTTTRNITNVEESFWVRTVLKIQRGVDTTDRAFVEDLERRLAEAFDEAFVREKLIQDGKFEPLNRRKRRRKRFATSGEASVHIHELTRQKDSTTVTVVYAVERSGDIMTSQEAVTTLQVLDDQELAIILRQVVGVKAETYSDGPDETPTSTEDNFPLWMIGAIAGGAGAVIIIIWIVICIYCKCCKRQETYEETEPELTSILPERPHRKESKSRPSPHSPNRKKSLPHQASKHSLMKASNYKLPSPTRNPVELFDERKLIETPVKREPRHPYPHSSPECSTNVTPVLPKRDITEPVVKQGELIPPVVKQGRRNSKNSIGPSIDELKLRRSSILSKERRSDISHMFQSTVSEDSDSVKEQIKSEKKKNKESLRDKYGLEMELPADLGQGYNEDNKIMLGMPSTAAPSFVIANGSPGKMKPTIQRRYSDGDPVEGENLEKAKTRMHQLLDDAFSLISPSIHSSYIENDASVPQEETRNNTKDSATRTLLRPDKEPQLPFTAYTNPAYTHSSEYFEAWSPYRASSDQVALISMPHTLVSSVTKLGGKTDKRRSVTKVTKRPASNLDILNTKIPNQQSVNSHVMSTHSLTKDPPEPIKLRTKDGGSRHTMGSTQSRTSLSDYNRKPPKSSNINSGVILNGSATSLSRLSHSDLARNRKESVEMKQMKPPNQNGWNTLRNHRAPEKNIRNKDEVGNNNQPNERTVDLIQNLRDELKTLKNPQTEDDINNKPIRRKSRKVNKPMTDIM